MEHIDALEFALAANREAQPVAYAVFADNGNIRIWSTDKGITENVGVPVPLYTAPPAPAVPEGWKLVPVEPTEEMLRAAFREASVYSPAAYRAMLGAAPESGK